MMKLIGYVPDSDPTIPGSITNCDAFVPSIKGMTGAPSPVSSGISALAAACRGAATLRQLDNTTLLFAGTATKLYKVSGTSWADVTRAVGGDYTLTSTCRWRFAQYGNVSLAVNKADTLQYTTSGAFAKVTKGGTDAPKASIVETVGQFVFLFDYDNGTSYTDGWICSAYGDYTDWTLSATTQCTSGRLISTPGIIMAGKSFGEQIVVYKDRSMYIGTYTSGAAVWTFNLVPGQTGALSQESVVNVGTVEDPRHIFMGIDDFYSFDGARPVPIGEGWVKNTVFTELNQTYSYACQAVYDRANSRVYFYYPSSNNDTCDKCVVYNTRTKQWGRDNRSIEACIDYSTAGATYADVGTMYSTYASIPSTATYGSLFQSGSSIQPAIFNTSHTIYTLTGEPGDSFFVTGDIGNEDSFTLLQRVRPIFINAPTTATMTNYYRNNLGESLSVDQTATYSNGKFDVLRSARWHRLKMSFTGNVEIANFTPILQQEGAE